MMTWPVGAETPSDHNIEVSQVSAFNHSVGFSQFRFLFVLPKLAKLDVMIHYALEQALAKTDVVMRTGITESWK